MYTRSPVRDIERELVPFAADQRVAILPWSPLAAACCRAKFEPGNPGPAVCAPDRLRLPAGRPGRLPGVLDALREVAAAHGVSVAPGRLAWTLTPGRHQRDFGAKTIEQLQDNPGVHRPAAFRPADRSA